MCSADSEDGSFLVFKRSVAGILQMPFKLFLFYNGT